MQCAENKKPRTVKAEAKEQRNETSKTNQNVLDADTDGSTSDQEAKEGSRALKNAKGTKTVPKHTPSPGHRQATGEEVEVRGGELTNDALEDRNAHTAEEERSKGPESPRAASSETKTRHPSPAERNCTRTDVPEHRSRKSARNGEKIARPSNSFSNQLKPAVRHSLPRRAEEHDGPYLRK